MTNWLYYRPFFCILACFDDWLFKLPVGSLKLYRGQRQKSKQAALLFVAKDRADVLETDSSQSSKLPLLASVGQPPTDGQQRPLNAVTVSGPSPPASDDDFVDWKVTTIKRFVFDRCLMLARYMAGRSRYVDRSGPTGRQRRSTAP